MSWKKLEESEYEDYFDALSKRLKDEKAEKAEIEVLAVGTMEEKQTGWISFYGISYDPPEKIVSIICEYIDHRIKQPQKISVHETGAGVDTVEIVGGDGYEHVLKFKEPIRR
ncbi:MAG TPA: hypothetical protein ENK96_06055 [Desulfobulbaceae bacterium]|nr:hypothetical protein [Desulfobulbaceae bacterium]